MNKQARLKKKILEQLEKIPIIEHACQKAGVPRSTYYRWINEDAAFKSSALSAEEKGRLSVNDIAESKLIQKINESDMRAIAYWLESNHNRYIKPRRPVILNTSNSRPEPVVVQIMGSDNIRYDTLDEYRAARLEKKD